MPSTRQEMISPSLSLQCNSTLLSLRLSGNKIGNAGALHLAGVLRVNHSLQELQLADCDLVSWRAGYCNHEIVPVLRPSLTPAGHSERDRARHRLAKQRDSPLRRRQPAAALQPPGTDAPSVAPTCLTDALDQSGLSQEEWAGHFAAMLAVNGGLLELHLGKMGMTDTGMERLAEGLQLNRSLRYLDLRW